MISRKKKVISTSVSKRRALRVAARRMVGEAVGGEATGDGVGAIAAGDDAQHPGGEHRADHLRDDVGNDVLDLDAAAGYTGRS